MKHNSTTTMTTSGKAATSSPHSQHQSKTRQCCHFLIPAPVCNYPMAGAARSGFGHLNAMPHAVRHTHLQRTRKLPCTCMQCQDYHNHWKLLLAKFGSISRPCDDCIACRILLTRRWPQARYGPLMCTFANVDPKSYSH